jgi:hypothetical protein
MVKLFLSHTSADKPFAKQLATSLMDSGYVVWLDEWEIKVGDSITQKIEKGIEGSDYLLLVLSNKSIQSKWVDREWRAKFGVEVESGRQLVLPCLTEKCDIPALLRDKKYADFIESFDIGFRQLMDKINPIRLSGRPAIAIDPTAHADEIMAIIAKLQSPNAILSECVTAGLILARKIKSHALEEFCRHELAGIVPGSMLPTPADEESHLWRVAECFASTIGPLNTNWIGFETEAGLFNFIENQPDKFVPMKLFWTWPVADIEKEALNRRPQSTAMIIYRKYKELMPGHGKEDLDVPLYMRPNVSEKLLAAIRRQFVSLLLSCLPSIRGDSSRLTEIG